MKTIKSLIVTLTVLLVFSCHNKDTAQAKSIETASKLYQDKVRVIPIKHGTLILESGEHVIYVDPTGGKAAFQGQKKPTLVLITDIHGDHLNIPTLEALQLDSIPIIVSEAVAAKIPSAISSNTLVLNNGEQRDINTLTIEAVPMYNLREEALKFHVKGRGNGYVLSLNGERIYISGDTEDIPEMRALKAIDKALVCMNLPYTMDVERAASAVLDFKPKEVIPYHYRGTNGFSDLNKFKTLVNSGNSSITVTLMEWYD